MIYAGVSLYARQVNALYFIYFLLAAAAFFVFGILISCFSFKKIHFSLVRIFLGIIVLCCVDQGIKIYIANNLDISVTLIKEWISIKVVQNTYGSFIWSLFGKKMSGLFFLPAVFALYVLYRILYFYQKSGSLFLFFVSFILLCAAFICVSIDKVVYGGTYDYICLYQMIYFDIKDMYLVSGIFTIFLSCIYDKSWPQIKQDIRRDPWGIAYYRYEFETWRAIIAKCANYKLRNKKNT
jgi:hypothetical protein